MRWEEKGVWGTFGWVEKNAAETRVMDQETGRLVRAGGQKTVIAGSGTMTPAPGSASRRWWQPAVEPAADKSAAKEDGKHRDMALEVERTVDRPDADCSRHTAKEAPEPPQRELEPEKTHELEMEI